MASPVTQDGASGLTDLAHVESELARLRGDARRSLLCELAELASRLIVDSGECGVAAAESVVGLTPSLTDLAWTRLAPWREALASLGDSPGGLKAYGRAHSVEAQGPENEA